MSATQKWSRMRRAASSNIWRHSAVGSTVTTIRRVSIGYSSAPASTGPSVGALATGAVGAQHPQRGSVADDEPGAVAAHGVVAHRVGDHVELASGQVEALQHGLLRLDVGARAAVAERAADREAVPEQAVLGRAHAVVAALDDGDRHHAGGEPLDVDDHLRWALVLLLLRRAPRRSRRRGRTGRARAGPPACRPQARRGARPGSPRTATGCARPAAPGTAARTRGT